MNGIDLDYLGPVGFLPDFPYNIDEKGNPRQPVGASYGRDE